LCTNESSLASEYIIQEKELYNQLRAISDLQFDTLDQRAQEELMRTVAKQDIPSGHVIIREGDDDDGGCFYLLLGTPVGVQVEAKVEIVRNVNGYPVYFCCHEFIIRSRRVLNHPWTWLVFWTKILSI
jgi:hypothetical protein